MGPDENSQGTETGTEESTVAQNGEVTETDSGSGGGDSINPAWNELLQAVPSSLHSQVTPHLTKWDQNFQSKINEVHSQYEPYKPYLERQVTPDQINYGLGLMDAIENRPLEVIKGLVEFAKQSNMDLKDVAALFGDAAQAEQQGQIDESEIPAEIFQHPAFVQMQKQLETVQNFLAQQQSSQQQAAEDKAIADEFAEYHKPDKYGEFDEDWVLTKAIADAQQGKNVTSLEPYVKQYKEFEKSVLERSRKPAPQVLKPGGIVPDNQLDVKKLSDKERREHVQQILHAAAQNSQ